jgi:hypothetical protein
VLDSPTLTDWRAATQMMNYMHQRKTQGIRFNSNGNSKPVVYVDASNKPDPTDSKCQYGYVHMWQGGPICICSKKLSHVGLSAAHNEYMALHWANRQTQWVRDILIEMDLNDVVDEPTATFGDNKAANLLCEEDIVTKGNQHYRSPYHYNKEMVNDGQVKVHWIASAENLADIFTKAVPRQVLDSLLTRLQGYA